MSIRDSLPSVRQGKISLPVEAVARSVAKSISTKDKSLPPIVRIERVSGRCGHEVEVPIRQGFKEEHLASRLERFRQKRCQRCIKDEQDAIRQRPKKPSGSRKHYVCSVCQEKQASHRLPDGSAFRVQYDAHSKMWVGSLVADVGGKPRTFGEQSEGVFGLLKKLDRLWQEAVKT